MSRHQPILSSSQEAMLFAAVGRCVAATVTAIRGVPSIAKQVGNEVAGIPVLGAFVSLKKDGRLRSCMGVLRDPMPLGDAVESAAVRSAKDDPRFPPITTAELSELDMEVWVLWGLEPLMESGRERANRIKIGRHGLQIIHGANRGLLLPGVAIEHGMDVEQFLEAVCQKAGLPKDTWYNDNATLMIFEGRAVAGRIGDINFDKTTAMEMRIAGRYQWKGTTTDGPTQIDVEKLREVCSENLRIVRAGGKPDRFYPALYDGKVSGVSIALNIPNRPLMLCSKVTIRPDIQLQPALMEMVQLIARQAENEGVTSLEIQDSRLDLSVYWGPEIHGNAENCDLSRVNLLHRSLMLTSPVGWVLQYQPDYSPKQLLDDCVAYLHLDDTGSGEVVSMETTSTTDTILVTNMSRREIFPASRPSVLAGTFYPADATDIETALDEMFRGQPTQAEVRESGKYGAVLVPHAGWIYSGKLAAETLAQVRIPQHVIVFCPKHRHSKLDWAVAPYQFWELPTGNVASDLTLASKLVTAVDRLLFDATPHRDEHAIEVLLPMLQRLRADVKVVGITMATAAFPIIKTAAEQMARFIESLPTNEQPLLVISSDMNHFASNDITNVVDQIAIDAMLTCKPEQVLAAVNENGISMCGAVAVTFVLETQRLRGKLKTARLIGHTTSAKRSGDYSRVVGYAGMVFGG
ncbi:MAG: AmmeMemoRadiSam system protein B [Planctomycetaceae bacterium]|jgi:AmmeMemoRadiSam system protein B/AmmeMemoRadiSam system protein A|nr:AmmeMemoRadiSam system protein B [Planctomycetaceae bacterium]